MIDLPKGSQLCLEMWDVVLVLNDHPFGNNLHREVVAEHAVLHRVRHPRQPILWTQVRIFRQSFRPKLFVIFQLWILADLWKPVRIEGIRQNPVTLHSDQEHFAVGSDSEDSHESKIFETTESQFWDGANLAELFFGHFLSFRQIGFRVRVDEFGQRVSGLLYRQLFQLSFDRFQQVVDLRIVRSNRRFRRLDVSKSRHFYEIQRKLNTISLFL